MRNSLSTLALLLLMATCTSNPVQDQPREDSQPTTPWDHGELVVSSNGRFLQHQDGTPFFWLGDTSWLLFQRLDRTEVIDFLDDRAAKGFNVIQCMVLHNLPNRNIYGDLATIDKDPSRPLVTPGNDPKDAGAYDYWDHVDYVIAEAAKRGIYVGMVCAWGSVAKSGYLTAERAKIYGAWLAQRYGGHPNIVWITGGDTRGDQKTDVWKTLANTLDQNDSNHLITFHPFGRTQSSTWFHEEPWLDFNMFQSGHRRYDQRGDEPLETWKGEDNWLYVQEDYAKVPPKPTLDGEPSYEDIPQGLHDPAEPYWQASDVRRYAYWSVFAGSCGHTYGHNAVIQMHKPGYGKGAFGDGSYGVRQYWQDAVHDPGAGQMKHLKNLILSRPYLQRVPDPGATRGDGNELYNRVLVTRGEDYLFAYTYTGRSFELTMGRITGDQVKAWWFDPRNGRSRPIGTIDNQGHREFDPPGEPGNGNDWVLALDDAARNYGPPGGSK